MVTEDLKAFTRRMKDLLSTVALTDRVKLIDFLNSSEQSTLELMAAKLEDVTVIFEGGFELAQRKRAVIFPAYMAVEAMVPKVSVFKIEVIGTGMLTHSQVLGALMGLNIDRSVIGDIAVDLNGAFFAACSEFDLFLKEHFTKVASHDIRLELVEETMKNNQQFEVVEIIVSSMRLDVVVKALIKASRSEAEKYLAAGFVRLNHMVDKKPSRTCHLGDILSIRKHGRFKIMEVKKTTKRGKLVLVVSKSI